LSGASPRWSHRSVLITTVAMTNLVADDDRVDDRFR
jgi:hypothetical protein